MHVFVHYIYTGRKRWKCSGLFAVYNVSVCWNKSLFIRFDKFVLASVILLLSLKIPTKRFDFGIVLPGQNSRDSSGISRSVPAHLSLHKLHGLKQETLDLTKDYTSQSLSLIPPEQIRVSMFRELQAASARCMDSVGEDIQLHKQWVSGGFKCNVTVSKFDESKQRSLPNSITFFYGLAAFVAWFHCQSCVTFHTRTQINTSYCRKWN